MLVDAHAHPQDERLNAVAPDWLEVARQSGVRRIVVNGTNPKDWPQVAELARHHPDILLPSFGLHPWRVNDRPDSWRDYLDHWLGEFPHAGVGEIGLDRWIDDHDLPAQEEVFEIQLKRAARDNRPASIHCLRVWGRMLELLQQLPHPERGFLLHSYGGPEEMVPDFVELGAHFSFCGAFLDERKSKTRDAFRAVPLDRLLLETDAPDQTLPESMETHSLVNDERRLNHPANLQAVYSGASRTLGISSAELTDVVKRNFTRFFEEFS